MSLPGDFYRSCRHCKFCCNTDIGERLYCNKFDDDCTLYDATKCFSFIRRPLPTLSELVAAALAAPPATD